ncbi:MAG: UDP-N-acetylglucosamine--N-acetylmuramyl-(pentapeptide) pyrophosphoryl-undecaprenol N-acetylglucosamine transferase, partial [Firmicutes bacterium]|nr:UDP-N-acetylglucosamine--N-acetylmuramyl-(pentapeptide) pyrophosphoryl-undecaprenol N-acetylglucosamine transferase [Bacillota bacterium]
MRVLMTGGGTSGHVNPALAIAETIKLNIPGSEIAFVGTPHGIENKLVPRAGYRLYHVDVKGFSRSLSPKNIKAAYLAAVSPHRAKKIIREFEPDVVIGTGGYVSWPVVKAGSKMGIHTMLHESNAYPGVAVKMLSGNVDRVMLNFADTEKYLKCPKDKLVVVGNPLREGFTPEPDKKAAKRRAGIDTDKYEKMILSYGGSMGAQHVNEAVLAMMRDYTSRHPEILHVLAVGAIEYEDATRMFHDYGLDKYENLRLLEYIYDMPAQMAAADLLICRSGAMTMSEVAAMRKPAIFI